MFEVSDTILVEDDALQGQPRRVASGAVPCSLCSARWIRRFDLSWPGSTGKKKKGTQDRQTLREQRTPPSGYSEERSHSIVLADNLGQNRLETGPLSPPGEGKVVTFVHS